MQLYCKKINGFTMLDVVISIFFVSIVFVGLALAQVSSLKSSNSMTLHTEAVSLQKFILERMLANAEHATGAGTSYDIPLTSMGSNPGCDSSSCSPAQIKQYDQFLWKQRLAAELPNGDGSISHTNLGPNGRIYQVDIQYDDFDTTGNLITRTVSVNVHM